MRFSSSVLLFAGAVMASEPQYECLVNHSQDLAAYSDCGHQGALTECLAQLNTFNEDAIRSCYTGAGCSVQEAWDEAAGTLRRCQEQAKTGELKKRYRAAPLPTMFARAESTTSGGIISGTKCFSTGKKSTTDCDVTTSDGHVKTNTCTPTSVTTSACHETMICTTDGTGEDICMEIVRMDVGGIIVSLVFAGALVIGVALLTWACCRDRSQQKKFAAKAEAVALARAATKKQRAAQRQPLIRNPSGGANPFQDQARS